MTASLQIETHNLWIGSLHREQEHDCGAGERIASYQQFDDF